MSGFETATGCFARNVLHFARTLRAAGLPVGPGRVLSALQAVKIAGTESRKDLYWVLFASFVSRRDQREIFDQCFHVYWRDPKLLERMMQLLLPTLETIGQEEQEQVNRRVAEALTPERAGGPGEPSEQETVLELDAAMTWSAREILQGKDFEQMSAAELEEAKREIARLRLPIDDLPTRRFEQNPQGQRIDMRRTLRRSQRGGAAVIDIAKKQPARRAPPLVVLCDISGSMSRYSRLLLLFVHTVANDRERVHSFVFGTRLTNISRYLRNRDVDIALDHVGDAVLDWSGGTRIGQCLKEFNQHWSRRVLGQGAVVLLISDGLDRDSGQGLAREMERLHKSCRRLIWLNPLLRFDRYRPIATGARDMIRHVDEIRSVHSLASLHQLTDALGGAPDRKAEQLRRGLRTPAAA